MKKLIAISIVIVLMASVGMGIASATKPGTDFSGPHFNLNIIGKKSDWNNKSGFDNPDRHTIFIPEDTSTFGYEDPFGTWVPGNVSLSIIQDKTAEDIYVIDGTAFDGTLPEEKGKVAIALPDKQYNVYICSRGKPGGETGINAKVYYDGLTNEYLISVGTLKVTRNWKDATDLFEVCPAEDTISSAVGGSTISTCMWVFDYLEYLVDLETGEQDSGYYWDINNNGNKLIKLRFYER